MNNYEAKKFICYDGCTPCRKPPIPSITMGCFTYQFLHSYCRSSSAVDLNSQ